jgi:hypothetical protein
MVRSTLGLGAVLSVASISFAGVTPTPEQMCEEAKLMLVGKTAGCEFGIAANPKKGNDFTRCTTRYGTAFPSVGTCSGDQTGLETQVDTFRSEIAAALTPNTSKCEAGKIEAAGKEQKCELLAVAKAVLVAGTADFTKCKANFATAFRKLEVAKTEDCTTTGDAAAIEADVDAFMGAVVPAISHLPFPQMPGHSQPPEPVARIGDAVFLGCPPGEIAIECDPEIICPDPPVCIIHYFCDCRPGFPRMPSHGGATLPKLQLQTVTFAGDPMKRGARQFGSFIVGSQWLQTITAEYGPSPQLRVLQRDEGRVRGDLRREHAIRRRDEPRDRRGHHRPVLQRILLRHKRGRLGLVGLAAARDGRGGRRMPMAPRRRG